MGKSTPSAPDPTATAAAQTQSNQQTAAFNQKLNMINSTGPNGSVTYTPSGAPGGYTQTTTLSPAQQNIFNQSTAAQGGALSIANDQLGRVSSALSQSINPSSFGTVQQSVAPTAMGDQAVTNAQNAAYGTATQYLTPQLQQQRASMDANLAAQGLNPNDTAYQNAQTLFNNQSNQAYQGAANAAVTAGQNEQNTLFNQAYSNATLGNTAQQQAFNQGTFAQTLPINEFSSLLGLGQVSSPTGVSYTPSSAASTDVAGITQNSYNDRLKNAQITNSATNSGLGGLFNLGMSFL